MDWAEELDQGMSEYLPDLDMVKDEPMSRHTSFRIGGAARRMARPQTGEQLVLLVDLARRCKARTQIIGNGTNLLVSDEALELLVIDTSAAMNALNSDEGGVLRAQSGVPLARLADLAQKQGLTGLEFAHGIPGTVGGALCMNAGAYGGEMAQVTESVTILDPEAGMKTLSGTEMQFGYRRSILTQHPDWVVLSAAFRLESGDAAVIRAQMEALMAKRKASQPLEYPSVGSTFKRPEGSFAGTLIETCGLKGLTIGGAQVSQKHAGFVINRGGATFADVMGLIARVQSVVFEKTGVQLEPEVKIIRSSVAPCRGGAGGV